MKKQLDSLAIPQSGLAPVEHPPRRQQVLLRAQSLAAQVADFIVDAIAAGTIEFGQRLVETDLSRQLDVSRVPIREALKMLEAQGILDVAPHRGAYVVEFDNLKIDRICQARVALERLTMPDAVRNLQTHPEKLSALEDLIARMGREAAHHDWVQTSKADLDFHRRICLASGNEIVITLWEALARHILIVFGREVRTEQDGPRLIQQHNQIVQLIRDGDLTSLDRELVAHIMRLRRNAFVADADAPGSEFARNNDSRGKALFRK
jgi:DNA-binding GntR family transcriptional regulator